jgi:hypothetical protein
LIAITMLHLSPSLLQCCPEYLCNGKSKKF